MSFASLVLVFFASPLYFLLRQRWIAFTLHLIFYLVAVFCLITIVLLPLGIGIWMVLLVHAIFGLRRDDMNERAQVMARTMAATLRETQPAERL